MKIQDLQKKPVTKFGSAIDSELLKKVQALCKKRKIKFKHALEYGLTQFLSIYPEARDQD
jgi:hypothetical protein